MLRRPDLRFLTHSAMLIAGAWCTVGCLSTSGSGGGNESEGVSSANDEWIDRCLDCGEAQCPTEHNACQSSAGCATLYDCSLRCGADAQCQNGCSNAAAGDSTIVSTSTNYSLCIAQSCLNECSGASAASSGTPAGGTPTPTPAPGPTPPPSPAPPTPSEPTTPFCDNLFTWSVGCAVDTEARFQSCTEATDFDKCESSCLSSSQCYEYEELKAGAENDLTACISSCALALGSTDGAGTFAVAEAAYVTAGDWSGFAWTATDATSSSTISPADFAAVAAGGSLCVSGTVTATSDYSGVAILGINLNQPNADPAPDPEPWTPNTSGLQYILRNTGGSPLRVQLQAPGGDTNADLRWCTDAVDGADTLSWSSFNTACWDYSGDSYDGSIALESVMILVPGGDLADISYAFCLESISPL